MNDRFLFRAKHVHVLPKNQHLDGQWIEGYLIRENYIYSPLLEGEFLIDESTICQCTGLTDKNGKLIWENDVISINTYSYEEPEDTVVGVVKYSEANTGFCLDNGDAWIPICEIYGSYLTEYFVEGNIFDNPELLEVEG